MESHLPLLRSLRVAPELRVWAVALFVASAAVGPVVHAHGHRDDHVHEGDLPGHTHGEHSPLHLVLALIDPPPPPAIPPVVAAVLPELPAPRPAPALRRFLLDPIDALGP